MASQNRSTLKGYFQTGDKPTESQFSDFIDSSPNFSDQEFFKWNSVHLSASDFTIINQNLASWLFPVLQPGQFINRGLLYYITQLNHSGIIDCNLLLGQYSNSGLVFKPFDLFANLTHLNLYILNDQILPNYFNTAATSQLSIFLVSGSGDLNNLSQLEFQLYYNLSNILH